MGFAGRMRPVPRGSIRSAMKKRLPELRLGSNVGMLIYLNCVMFLQRLAAEARHKSVEDRSSVIRPSDIRAVAKVVLKMFKG